MRTSKCEGWPVPYKVQYHTSKKKLECLPGNLRGSQLWRLLLQYQVLVYGTMKMHQQLLKTLRDTN